MGLGYVDQFQRGLNDKETQICHEIDLSIIIASRAKTYLVPILMTHGLNCK